VTTKKLPSNLTTHLKLLPLTVTLTVLLWLYADAHLTATQQDLPLRVKFAAVMNNHSMTVSVRQPQGGEYQISLTGRKSRVNQVADQLFGRAILTSADRHDLTYAFDGSHFRYGKTYTFDTLRLLNSLPYFRRHHVAIIAARPRKTELTFDRLVKIRRPIEFSAIPDVTATISPATAVVTMAGSMLLRIGGPHEVSVTAQPLQSLTGLQPGSHQHIEAQLVVHYPGIIRHAVKVNPVTAVVSFIAPHGRLRVLHLGAVPIWVDGPPWILSRYDVRVRPTAVALTVFGTDRTIRHLETDLALGSGAPINKQIIGFVTLSPSATSTTGWIKHHVHYTLPRGVSIVKGPHSVRIKVSRRQRHSAVPLVPATTSPAEHP
jgi:hypothetical protein